MAKMWTWLLLLHSILSCSDALSSPAAPASSSTARMIENLQQFVERQGAKVDGMAISTATSDQRTLVATRELPAGHTLLRMPMALGITAERAAQECPMAALEAANKDAVPSDLLALWLLSTQNDDNPYVASLPTRSELAHLPIHWPPSDRQHLKGTELAVQLALQQEQYVEKFEGLSSSSKPEEWTLEDWTWAKGNVQSRAFTIANPLLEEPALGTCLGEESEKETDDDDEEEEDSGEMPDRVICLFPFADMANHANPCNCQWGMERESREFVFQTKTPVAANSELTISYGSHSASGCLLSYGFVPEDQEDDKHNDDDVATIKVSLDIIAQHNKKNGDDEDPSSSDLKTRVWSRDEDKYPTMGWEPMERTVLMGVGTAGAAQTVLSLLRVGVATDEELEDFLDLHSETQKDIPAFAAEIARHPCNWRNEREAFRVLESVLMTQMDRFHRNDPEEEESTTTKDDDDDNDLTANQWNAQKAVAAESKVLWHWLGIARMVEGALDNRRSSFDFGLKYSNLLQSLLGTREQAPRDR